MSRRLPAFVLAIGLGLVLAGCLSGGGGRVSPPPVTVPETLAIERPPALRPGGTAQLHLVLVHPDHSGVDMTAGASWTSSNPAVATISAAGVVNAVAAGTCTITARSGGRQATTSLKVDR